MKTQVAVDALCEALNGVPSSADDQQWKERADIIINFAEWVSREVLLRCGIDEADKDWIHKSLVNVLDPSDGVEAIPDFVGPMVQKFQDLYLEGIRSDLSNTEENTSICEHEFAFCRGRVIEWDNKRGRIHRVMTYEASARFVVFWLAEKILQIIRKNEWDRVRQLPDLYDRLATFFTVDPRTKSLSGEELRYRLKLPYDPDLLLLYPQQVLGSERRLDCSGTGFSSVFTLVTQPIKTYVDSLSLMSSVGNINSMLEARGLSLEMQLPPEVVEWYFAKKAERSEKF